ncbi:reverse transcriptase domain-containing protein [Tanacetum coccineum]
MDDPNITMEEYIMLEEEKAHRRGKVYNWETATYGKIWYDKDVHNLGSVETEYPAIVFNDALTSEVTLSCEPTLSPLNDNKIDFGMSFDKSDDEDYMVNYDKNSFSYKIIFVNNLKTDLENDNDKVNMPSFPSPEPTVSYFDNLDYFKDFEKEFSAIVYNDSLTSKLDFLTEPTEREWVGRGGRGRGPRGGNDERVDELNGQGNGQGLGANENVEGVNGNVEGVNGGVGEAPDFSTIIAQQLQNLLPAILAQVGNQGNVGNQNGNVVNENVQENVRNVLVNGKLVGCSYKEFLACKPKEYDVKYTAGSFVGKALTWWNSQIRTLSQEVTVSMSWNDFKLMMIDEFCPSHEMQKLETELWNHAMVGAGHAAYTDRFHELARFRVTDEAVRNGSIKKVEKRGNVGEPSKDKNGRDDNKRTRTENAFTTTANPVGRENTGVWPKCGTCNSYHAPEGPCRTCFA